MKRSVSLLSNLLLSSTLFWGVPTAQGEILGPGEIVKVPAENAAYCHMKFPAMHENSLSLAYPVFDDGAVHTVDFYGSCDYDPLGIEEIRTQRRVILRGIYEEGE